MGRYGFGRQAPRLPFVEGKLNTGANNGGGTGFVAASKRPHAAVIVIGEREEKNLP